MSKKIQVLKVKLTTNERYFEKGDLVKLNFNELLAVGRPEKINEDEWTIDLVPMDSYYSESAQFVGTCIKSNP